MAGKNLALSTEAMALESASRRPRKPCIFLSHITEDKKAVKAIGDYIMEEGNLNIYLDIHDADLQRAVSNNDAKGITEFIERGLKSSTHLMCLYSKNTVGSWWVPYEIGYGKCSDSEVSSLKLKGNVDLPAFLEVGTMLLNMKDLNKYLQKIATENKISPIFESANLSLLSDTTLTHPINLYLDRG